MDGHDEQSYLIVLVVYLQAYVRVDGLNLLVFCDDPRWEVSSWA